MTIPLALGACCSLGHGPATQVAVQASDKSLWPEYRARSSELWHPSSVLQPCWQAVRRVNLACSAEDFDNKRVTGPDPEVT